jgi:tRNA pseudouridine13 synthase
MSTDKLAHALSQPKLQGTIRTTPEDFQVDEVLGFDPDGSGEHVCLHIRKRGANTADIAKQLAKLAGVKNMDVSYAGLKDRHAVTTQWFSIYLGNKPEPDWSQLESDSVQVLTATRHQRKLRRGTLKGNRFKLVVRDLTGDTSDLEQRLQTIATAGVPNYFGEQRFGYNNLEKATAMFEGQFKVKDRNKRSLYLSAARSAIFNHVLSRRVADGNWNQPLDGDVMMLDGSHSVFPVEQVDDEIRCRIQELDIHPTGPLWGRGELRSAGEVKVLEQSCAADYELFCGGLEQAGMKQERRALRLPVREFQWQLMGDSLDLDFYLPSGSYATAVLRELIDYTP